MDKTRNRNDVHFRFMVTCDVLKVLKIENFQTSLVPNILLNSNSYFEIQDSVNQPEEKKDYNKNNPKVYV